MGFILQKQVEDGSWVTLGGGPFSSVYDAWVFLKETYRHLYNTDTAECRVIPEEKEHA